MSDSELLDWLESVRAEIRWREYLPDNNKTDKPWWVCVEGHVPQTGPTFREAAVRAREAMKRLQSKREER